MPQSPRLLVSVRNAEEAGIAASAGVDLLDFKEPTRGSLGMVKPGVLREAFDHLRSQFPEITISAACGEVLEHISKPCERGTSVPCSPEKLVETLPAVEYLKLGLAGLGTHSDWKERWTGVRDVLSATVEVPGRPNWIAVAYVDDELAQSPPVEDVIDAAIEAGCAGVLFDTWSKGQGKLFDYVSEQRLRSLTAEIQQSGLLVAAAGRLSIDDARSVCETGVDIIAIRSAACAGEDRRGSISLEAIQHFRAEMEHSAVIREHAMFDNSLPLTPGPSPR